MTHLVSTDDSWSVLDRTSPETRVLIERNGARCTADQQQIKAFTTTIAKGQLRDGDLVKWVDNHMEDL